MKTVEPRPAIVWTCDPCGTDHFVRLSIVEPELIDAEAEEELREQMGIEPWEEFEFADNEILKFPDEVTCPDCQETYATEKEDWE